MDRDIRRTLARKYNGMKQRCYNPKNSEYKNYGARGIGISESAVWMRIKRGIQVDMEPYKWEKPVIRDDGAIFHSVKEAAKSVGVHDTKVSAVCKGNRKTTGGHSFRFLTREEAEKALEAMK